MDSSEQECFLDLTMRKNLRLKYPGACSLEYQSAMQIVLQVLLGWDCKTKRGVKGILGIVEAFGKCDEEQGRKTLHSHWKTWVEGFGKLRNLLFHEDLLVRKRARIEYSKYVDMILSATFGTDLVVTHSCNSSSDENASIDENSVGEPCQQNHSLTTVESIGEVCLHEEALNDCTMGFDETVTGSIDEIFEERESQVLRDARMKVKCDDVRGKLLQCNKCMQCISTKSVVNMALEEWKNFSLRDRIGCDGTFETSDQNGIILPLKPPLLDIAAYRYPYDFDGFNGLSPTSFWGNMDMRRVLLRLRFDEHACEHRASCFKNKNNADCRFFLPCEICAETYIFEDRGNDDEYVKDWYYLDGSVKKMAPYLVIPKRNQGCQYLNSHSIPISSVLGCNTNIQLGDAKHTYYVTNYISKSTQEEDKENYVRASNQVIKRIKRMQNSAMENGEEECNNSPEFVEGLSRILSGMYANTSKTQVSSTLGHLLVCQNGSRFTYSHDFKDLLLSQVMDHLEGNEVCFVLRRNVARDGTKETWPDSSVDDYLHRPNELENMCIYEQTMWYKKHFYSFAKLKSNRKRDDEHDANDDEGDDEGDDGGGGGVNESGRLFDTHAVDADEDTNGNNDGGRKKRRKKEFLQFLEDHPGSEYSCLEKNDQIVIPKLSIPANTLCNLEELNLSLINPNESIRSKREAYAKVALMLFCPFRELDDLVSESGSYWEKFREEQNTDNFWPKGKEILQNIQTRKDAEKLRRARDPVTVKTVGKSTESEEIDKSSQNNAFNAGMFGNDDYMDETLRACPTFSLMEEYSQEQMRSSAMLIDRMNLTEDQMMNSRLKSKESNILLDRANEDDTDTGDGGGANSAGINNPNSDINNGDGARSFPTLLTFIKGSLVREVTNDDDVDSDDENVSNPENLAENMNSADSQRHIKIPTMHGVLKKIEKKRTKETGEVFALDEKQVMAYEIMCGTFLLGLIRECGEFGSPLWSYFSCLTSAGADISETKNDLVRKLLAMGAKFQLLMYLTGAAGAGKSTAVECSEQFCHEFCAAVSVIWADNTFYYTATTGSAAALFAGTTIHSASWLNRKSVISDEECKLWEHVRMLIIDEISYFSDKDLNKLNLKLQRIKGVYDKPFGGVSIVFAGDFHQCIAIGVSKSEGQLYSTQGKASKLWSKVLNVAIILENTHRFQKDPEYGELLTRMWNGTDTIEDRKKINERVLGKNGLTLPDIKSDADTVYACPRNVERNAITAGIFREHIRDTHPMINSDTLPPGHTLMIEASMRGDKNQKLSRALQDKILTQCGDDDIRSGQSKKIDPCLRLYVGVHCMCIDNDGLKKNGTGNGTGCRVIGIKLKEGAIIRWKNWEGRKVNTVSVDHVEYVEFEHFPKPPGNFKKIFRLEPKRFTGIRAKVQLVDGVAKQTEFNGLRITQIPVNINDATTGHKLQGMSKDMLIIVSWGYAFVNWVYTVLSRVRTFEGLFLFEPLDLHRSFEVPPGLFEHEIFLRQLEERVVSQRDAQMEN